MAADPTLEGFLTGVVGVVEATSYERQMLWDTWHQRRGVAWVENLAGHGRTVGQCDAQPVCISLLTAVVDGQKVAFIEATSQVVDWRLIDKWLVENLPSSAKIDGRANKVDASNFHNVFQRR